MGSSVNFPVGRGDSSTTANVADLIAGLALPNIGPLSSDIAAMTGLPALPVPKEATTSNRASVRDSSGTYRTSSPNPPSRATASWNETPECTTGDDDSQVASDTTAERPSKRAQSQLEAVRMLMDECADGVAALHRHQNQCTALAAVLIDRFQAAARLEATILTLGS